MYLSSRCMRYTRNHIFTVTVTFPAIGEASLLAIVFELELCAAAAAADQMSASRRRRFRDVFTSCCTSAMLLAFCNVVNNGAWTLTKKTERTTRACFAIALDTQTKHGGVKAKVFSWTVLWKWKLILKVLYGTSLEIWLINRMVQWNLSTACTVINAYKVMK